MRNDAVTDSRYDPEQRLSDAAIYAIKGVVYP
jgi:hypothetical protein